LLRNAADGRIYFAEGNNIVKRWIISGVVYDRYHFNWSGYVNATQAMLDAYPTGPDLK
jgi:hypothetical protein